MKKTKKLIETDIKIDIKDEEFQEEMLEVAEEFKDEILAEELKAENLDLNFYELNTNKHRREGKHALKRDTILKGKKPEPEEERDENERMRYNSIDKIDPSSIYEFEYRSNEDYVHQKDLADDVYYILSEDLKINFKSNRKKPQKDLFNKYYETIMNKLGKKYTRSEIFVELAYYFTDSIFNCFKLLNKDYSLDIIKELKDKGFLKEIDNLNFT